LVELMVAKGLNPLLRSNPPPAESALRAGLTGIGETLLLMGGGLF
jgi:hypothetical protein